MSMTMLNKAGEAILADDRSHKQRAFRDSKHFQPLMVAFLCFGFATFLSVYMLYYMKVFLDVYHISTGWIQIVQALFLVWNAVNDPMMGYLQDIGCCGMTWIMDRRKVILYTAPVFAFSYMIFWFPWSTTNTVITGIHLLVGLFLFDTILTLVLSAYCGILVETCSKHTQRVRCVVYCELFLVLGGAVIFPLNVFSDEAKSFGKFQIGCAIIAVLGAVSMTGGAYFLNTKQQNQQKQEEIEMTKDIDNNDDSKDDESSFKKAMKVSWEIVKEPRFLCLVGAQFMRSMRMVATGTFQMILIGALVSRPGFFEAGSPAISMFYAIINPIGSILFMLLWKPLSILGTHKMMLILLGIALANVVIAIFLGRADPLVVIVFLGIEQISTSTGGRSFMMLLSGEVVDTDTKVHKRTSPLSTLIFTLKALFTKPAEQLSPLIFITLLDRGGFTENRAACIREAPKGVAALSNSTDFTTMAAMIDIEQPKCTTLLDTMHSSMLYFTLFCTIGEIVIICLDYWYKKRVLKEEDSKANPMEMPLTEEEFIMKKQAA